MKPIVNEDNSSVLEVSLRLSWPKSYIKITSTKENIQAMVTGDFFLMGTVGRTCRPDPLTEVCCLSRAQVKDMIRKLPTLVQPSGCYLLLIFQLGSNEIATRNPKAIKKDWSRG